MLRLGCDDDVGVDRAVEGFLCHSLHDLLGLCCCEGGRRTYGEG